MQVLLVQNITLLFLLLREKIDEVICNSVGVYKNGDGSGNGLFGAENNFLKNLTSNKNNTKEKGIELNEIVLYPNPTNSQLNIKYKCDEDTKLQIINMYGSTVVTIKLSKEVQLVQFSIKNLSNGVYTYKISNDSVNITSKLIKE